MTDTDRLNFLLKYISIDDIGDEEFVPGIIIKSEDLEDDLTWGKSYGELNTRKSHLKTWNDDLRDVIDSAIKSHNQEFDKD